MKKGDTVWKCEINENGTVSFYKRTIVSCGPKRVKVEGPRGPVTHQLLAAWGSSETRWSPPLHLTRMSALDALINELQRDVKRHKEGLANKSRFLAAAISAQAGAQASFDRGETRNKK